MRKLRGLIREHKALYAYLIIFFIATAFLLFQKNNKPLMSFIAQITLWIRQALAEAFDLVPVSVAELLVICAGLAVLIYIVKTIRDIIKSKKRLRLLYDRFIIALGVVLTVFLLFNLFLGSTYWGDSFQDKSGIYALPSTVDQLYETTKFFADKASESGAMVRRDEHGLFNEPIDEIFQNSNLTYGHLGSQFPFLSSGHNKPKKLLFSKLMSRLSYTGFYFPFTGEANINIDAPASFLPSTIAHEQAHQRGIAFEQEANFVAVLACIGSEDPAYVYSGYLLGFIHLNNALYRHDRERFNEVYASLSDEVKADLQFNNEYWRKYESPISGVSDAVYDTFLKSYGQELGILSYGAVVDLLVTYFGSALAVCR